MLSRVVIATVLLGPLALTQLLLHQPFLVATLATSCASILARPRRYKRTRHRIVACYAVSVSLPLTLLAHLGGVTATLTAGGLTVLVVASRQARFHPPIAGVPLALMATSPLQVALAGLAVVVGSCYVLAVLIPATALLSRQSIPRHAPQSPGPSRSCSPTRESA
jgi:hypothetical protein